MFFFNNNGPHVYFSEAAFPPSSCDANGTMVTASQDLSLAGCLQKLLAAHNEGSGSKSSIGLLVEGT